MDIKKIEKAARGMKLLPNGKPKRKAVRMEVPPKTVKPSPVVEAVVEPLQPPNPYETPDEVTEKKPEETEED